MNSRIGLGIYSYLKVIQIQDSFMQYLYLGLCSTLCSDGLGIDNWLYTIRLDNKIETLHYMGCRQRCVRLISNRALWERR